MEKNNNNANVNVFKFKNWTIRDQAYVDVLSKVIEQPFFTELRTNQQLGYVVAAFAASTNGFNGLATLIQSPKYQPMDIYNRSSQFLRELMKKTSETIADKDIEPIKAALVHEITKQPNTLSERLGRFVSMAATYHGDFQLFDKLVREINAINADSLKAYIKEQFVDRKEPSEITLLYYGTESKKEEIPKEFVRVKDEKSFRSSQPHIQPYRESKNMK